MSDHFLVVLFQAPPSYGEPAMVKGPIKMFRGGSKFWAVKGPNGAPPSCNV